MKSLLAILRRPRGETKDPTWFAKFIKRLTEWLSGDGWRW